MFISYIPGGAKIFIKIFFFGIIIYFFLENDSVIVQIFILRQIANNSIEQRLPVHSIIFIEFKQVCDTVKREKVYKTMGELEIPSKYFNLVRMTLQQTYYKVLVYENI